MQCFSTLACSVVAALAFAMAQPALAQTGASGTISLDGYALYDLDESDGVTPWLTWENGGSGALQASASAGIWGTSDHAYERARLSFILSPNTGVTFFANASLSTFGVGTRASAELQATVANEAGYAGEAWAWEGENLDMRIVSSAGSFSPAAVQGWVEIATSSNGVVSAVPEPATSAMLLGGAAILMIAGRRRRY